MYLIDDFVTVKPGEPFRLFPFGKLFKNGNARDITPEIAAQFKLPHFKPPIKLGSHDDTTAAGGFITGLEVRDDGLYALAEFNEQGLIALQNGSFRYHSPEVIWEGGYENPQTGGLIEGPLIVGDALLHSPHLGEAAALYTVEPITTEDRHMTDETVTVSVTLLDRLFGRVQNGEPVKPQPPAQDNYAVELQEAKAKADKLAAELADIRAAEQRRQRVAQFAAGFTGTAAADDTELHEQLAGLDNDAADFFSNRIKALAEQVNVSNLTSDPADNTKREIAPDAFTAKVDELVKAGKNRAAAILDVARNHGDLYQAYIEGGK